MKANTPEVEKCNCANFNKDIIDTSECELHRGTPHTTVEGDAMEEKRYPVEFMYVDENGDYQLIPHVKDWLHHQLQKARTEGFKEGYKQGKLEQL